MSIVTLNRLQRNQPVDFKALNLAHIWYDPYHQKAFEEATLDWVNNPDTEDGEIFYILSDNEIVGITGWFPATLHPELLHDRESGDSHVTVAILRWHGISPANRSYGFSKRAMDILCDRLCNLGHYRVYEAADTDMAASIFTKGFGFRESTDAASNNLIREAAGMGNHILVRDCEPIVNRESARKVVVIYHGNCSDGFTAAWCARKCLKGYAAEDVTYYPAVYGNEPPLEKMKGADVFILDFSYKLPQMIQVIEAANTVRVLDHHQSAFDEVGGLVHPKLGMIFDMNRSGARIAWDYFVGATPPALLLHIEDRDLFRFRMPCTREIQANVFSYAYTFEEWDKLFEQPVNLMTADGTAILRKHDKDIAELAGVLVRNMVIGGQIIPVANVPYTLGTDMAVYLLQKCPDVKYAGYYYDTPHHRVFGLRARHDDNTDVQAVAVAYGGGGHVKASGFRLSFAKASLLELPFNSRSLTQGTLP